MVTKPFPIGFMENQKIVRHEKNIDVDSVENTLFVTYTFIVTYTIISSLYAYINTYFYFIYGRMLAQDTSEVLKSQETRMNLM